MKFKANSCWRWWRLVCFKLQIPTWILILSNPFYHGQFAWQKFIMLHPEAWKDIQWIKAGEPAGKPFISSVPEILILQESKVKAGMYLFLRTFINVIHLNDRVDRIFSLVSFVFNIQWHFLFLLILKKLKLWSRDILSLT